LQRIQKDLSHGIRDEIRNIVDQKPGFYELLNQRRKTFGPWTREESI